MKKIILALLIGLVAVAGFAARKKFYNPEQATKSVVGEKGEIKSGDIIFQSSTSGQSLAIQMATRSKYSHCGIIYKNGDDYFVYEAVEPVKLTPLKKWIDRGDEDHFVIKRLKNADEVLTPAVVQKMRAVGETFNNKHYDIYFGWSDEKIYCSELVWKIYKQGAGIEVGKLEKLKDFDLTNPIVKQKLAERYGSNIPMEET